MNALSANMPDPRAEVAPESAPENAAERTARHLAACRDLIEAGMQLARAQAAKFLNPPPEAEPPQPRPQAPDPTICFLRLAAMIHRTIALEIRLANGQPPRAPRAAPNAAPRAAANATPHATAAPGTPRPLPADPRRAALYNGLDHTTENRPDRATIRSRTWARAEQELAANPQAEAGDLFTSICAELGIEVDYGKMPNPILIPLLPAEYQPPANAELPEGWPQHAYEDRR